VLFEFEAELYKKAGVPVEFTGHPILDTAKISSSKDAIIEKLRLDRTKKTITLLPGSRRREIELLLPVMLSASRKIYKKSGNIQFIIVKSPSLRSEIFERKLRGFEAPCRLVENKESELYECLSISDLAIAASGTVTLECAIMNVPVIITYKVSLLNAVVMKLFMRVRYVGLVNILGGRKIVPELIQYSATAGNIFKEAERILFEPGRSDWIKSELFRVKKYLGENGASRRAAISVVNFLEGGQMD
ncbi:MAG: lipid-A-disaccharide synthase, partial [Candidatus Omnitrophota bacterium]|nr:lipid-A-disaccharide synthase [Candidatus Omnitrophota bacterium]